MVKDATCKDRNLIYALVCNQCAKTVYVGETEQMLKERTTEHRRDIKFQKDKPIMQLFWDHEEKDLSVAILTRKRGENKIFRLICEENWIKTLETAFPCRCNVKINLQDCFNFMLLKQQNRLSFRNYCIWIFLFYKKLHMAKLSMRVKLIP